MRSHDLILERKDVVLNTKDYKYIRVGDWVDVLSPDGKSVQRCIRVESVMPLTGRTRYQRGRGDEPENLEEYLVDGRLALCPLYGKRLTKLVQGQKAA